MTENLGRVGLTQDFKRQLIASPRLFLDHIPYQNGYTSGQGHGQ